MPNIGNTGERSSVLFVSFWKVKRVLIIIQLGILSIWLVIGILLWEVGDAIAQGERVKGYNNPL